MSKNVVSSVKISGLLWGLIDKVLPEAEIKRNKILCDLGDDIHNNVYTETIKLITVGELYYLKIRKVIEEYIKLPKITIDKKTDKVKTNKSNTIILENSYKPVEDILNNIIVHLKNKNINLLEYEKIIQSVDYIELRIIILMKYIEYYTKHSKTENERNCKEILLASKKVIHNLKQNQKNFKKIFVLDNYEISLSEILINDLNYKIEELNSKSNYTLHEIANKYPKLIFDTRYDSVIPEIKLKPYDTQVQLINEIKNNFENGFLINLRVLTGLGKTSSITAICKYVNNIHNSNIKVIFCCSDLLDTVRIQVAKLMSNFKIKFGIGVGSLPEDSYKINSVINNIESKKKYMEPDKSPSYIITTSYNCGKIAKSDNHITHQHKKLALCEIVICDYITTFMLLKENKYEYVLFFDEPTIKVNNEIVLFYLTQIMYYSPKRMILSSATLPLKNEIDNYYDFFKNKYEEANIIEISSNKVLVGCVIKDFNNNIITPHINCKNIKELKNFIIKIKNYPLLGKFYTLTYLINLNKFLEKYNFNIDITKIETFDQENILENILLLLQIVCDNEIINFVDFINITCANIDENKINKDLLPENYDTLIHEKLLTTHSFKFLGCCLISVEDPEKYVEEHFSHVIKKLKEKIKISTISKMYSNYIKIINGIDEEINKIELSMKDDENDIKGEAIKKLHSQKPEFPFPNKLQINTPEHMKQFSKYANDYDFSLLNNKMDYKNLNTDDFMISDDLKFLLYMGIGCYSKNIDGNYCNTVLNLLNERKLAFIIADDSFCYGANYAISSVIITDSIGNNNTINTILQLIGRTGRVGKSDIGQAYIDKNTLQRLINFFNNDDNNDEEGKIIHNSFEIIQKYNEEQKLLTIHKINKDAEKIQKLKENAEKEELLKKEQMEKEIQLQSQLKHQSRKYNESTWERRSMPINNFTQLQSRTQRQTQTQSLETKNIINKEKKIKSIFGLNINKELTEEQKKFREKFM